MLANLPQYTLCFLSRIEIENLGAQGVKEISLISREEGLHPHPETHDH